MIPQGGDEAFSGTLFGGSAGDPAVYDLAGTATPGGTVSGTLTGVDPSTPTLDFSGTWQLDGGSTTNGTFEAVITGGATPGVSGRVFGRFEQASPPTPGTFRGRWRLSTR